MVIAVAVRHSGAMKLQISHHKSTVATEAQVPGPGRSHPMPKKVAVSHAQRPARDSSLFGTLRENSVFKGFNGGVLNGCPKTPWHHPLAPRYLLPDLDDTPDPPLRDR